MPPHATIRRRSRGRREAIEVHVAGRPVVSLTPSVGRVEVGLVMHPLDRVIDISSQPGAACKTLLEARHRAYLRPETVEGAAWGALREASERSGSWVPDDDVDLLAAFGGAAFPLLAAAYDAGIAPVREVPRWAEPVVAARNAREGAMAAFGDRSTRPVVRALASALAPADGGEVGFSKLALAMIGVDVLEPDRLARVLASPSVAHPAGDLPDPSTLRRARRELARWGPIRAERLLLDAAARPDGVKVLLDTVRWSCHLRGHTPDPLPNRLTELHDVLRSRIASAPPPPPPPAPPVVARRHPATAMAGPVRHQHRIFAPPVDLPPLAASTQLPAGPEIRALDGHRVDGLSFVVPRTVGDLQRWGRLLSTCVGDFGPSVVAGRSTIIGIERANALAFAVEIDPHGTIRQFAGRANRAPDDATRTTVTQALLAAGALAPPRQPSRGR